MEKIVEVVGQCHKELYNDHGVQVNYGVIL